MFETIFPAYFMIVLTLALASMVTSAIYGGNFCLNRTYLKIVTFVLESAKTQVNYDYEDDDDDPPPEHHENELQHQNSVPTKCLSPDAPPIFLLGDSCDSQHEFQLDDAFTLIQKGITAIIDDQVTKRFNTEELHSWNLLTRTSIKHYRVTLYLGLSWFVGFIIRYLFLLPIRLVCLTLGLSWLITVMAVVGCLPEPIKSKVYWHMSLITFRMLSCSITATLEFHHREYRAQRGDICVANHTSPIDVVMLACDNVYALVGQRHTAFLGLLQRALSRAANHVWFERSATEDRHLVTQRLIEHVSAGTIHSNNNINNNNNQEESSDKSLTRNLPILIFPEGTCINNSAVMMFKKGSFEASDTVCPVAIKYDLRYGDPFWNSSKQGYFMYLLMMMSSWAIKCDIWYLPPMTRLPEERSEEFANRVKHEIAQQGGLVDLAWNGDLKRITAKVEWKHKQQEDFARRLKLD